jgi:hypothetical protein
LERLVAVGKGAARRLTHAPILLLADTASGQQRADAYIVAALGTSVRTVERVRQRLVTEGLQAALNPRPQPLRPAKVKIKGDVEQRLLQLVSRCVLAMRKSWGKFRIAPRRDLPPRHFSIGTPIRLPYSVQLPS